MTNLRGALNLGHVLAAAGIDPDQVIVIRHTYRPDHDYGLRGPEDVTPERVLNYTRCQDINTKTFPAAPPRLWLVFIKDGGSRSRFFGAYENHGEVTLERTQSLRYFELTESDALEDLANRLVLDWGRAAIRWWMKGLTASLMPVLEIASPESVPFPGFDSIELDYSELVAMTEEKRYEAWRHALGEVKGIYSIADRSSGRLYIGKADGVDGILGRWRNYATDGHGGNKTLRQLSGLDPEHKRHFVFGVLRVFGKSAAPRDIDDAESHFKRVLLTREFGNNEN